MRRKARLRRGAGYVGVLAILLVTASCIQGPIVGPGAPNLATGVAQPGYQQSEFFLAGLADAYTPTAPLTSDGKWTVTPDPASSDVGFHTRLVVQRPVDPARFNGTVVVEWLNVSAGADLPNDWTAAHNELVRTGTAWVGMSVQAAGVANLESCCSARYGTLVHPGDSFSYDMFTVAGRAIRTDPKVLGGLTPARILAAGESQSASRLVTYVNAIHPLVDVYDGFLLHSRGASGSALSQSPLTPVSPPTPSFIRDDLAEPVFVVQAEDDVIRSALAVRQPDTPAFRQWEMAGTAHADAYMSNVGFSDVFDGTGAVRMLGLMLDPNPPPAGCASPFNAGASHWILQAAYNRLDAWVRTGAPPAAGSLLEVESTGPVVLARDDHGNALGGVRSPHVDVPIATVDGINSGPGFCLLFGSTTPFTPEKLAELYPTHEDFVQQWTDALLEGVANGFLLPADAYELLGAAVSAPVPS